MSPRPKAQPPHNPLHEHLLPHIPALLDEFRTAAQAPGRTSLPPNVIANLAPHLTPGQSQSAARSLTAFIDTPDRPFLRRLAALHALRQIAPQKLTAYTNDPDPRLAAQARQQ